MFIHHWHELEARNDTATLRNRQTQWHYHPKHTPTFSPEFIAKRSARIVCRSGNVWIKPHVRCCLFCMNFMSSPPVLTQIGLGLEIDTSPTDVRGPFIQQVTEIFWLEGARPS